jgi:hypothetical protein
MRYCCSSLRFSIRNMRFVAYFSPTRPALSLQEASQAFNRLGVALEWRKPEWRKPELNQVLGGTRIR